MLFIDLHDIAALQRDTIAHIVDEIGVNVEQFTSVDNRRFCSRYLLALLEHSPMVIDLSRRTIGPVLVEVKGDLDGQHEAEPYRWSTIHR